MRALGYFDYRVYGAEVSGAATAEPVRTYFRYKGFYIKG
jgi:hypothetical protein